MSSDQFRGIRAFLAVAQERSFTRAAVKLGISQSALSHTIRGLESRLGLRLLTRTTRSVAPTEAGERLFQSVAKRLEVIEKELVAFSQLRDKPTGIVRITTSDFAANTVLWPKLSQLQPKYPDVKIELTFDPGLVDIVGERFDAGVRFGDQVAKDMTSVPISANIRMLVVGSPSYLAKHPPVTTPSDLTEHDCINVRFSTQGGVYAWELKKGKRSLRVKVDGPWTFNCIYPALEAALSGFGLAYVPEELAKPYIENKRLGVVLKDWSPTFPGLHIFYANRSLSSPALSLIIDALRYPE